MDRSTRVWGDEVRPEWQRCRQQPSSGEWESPVPPYESEDSQVFAVTVGVRGVGCDDGRCWIGADVQADSRLPGHADAAASSQKFDRINAMEDRPL